MSTGRSIEEIAPAKRRLVGIVISAALFVVTVTMALLAIWVGDPRFADTAALTFTVTVVVTFITIWVTTS